MRNCKSAGNQNNTHPSVQLYLICIWASSGRSVRVFLRSTCCRRPIYSSLLGNSRVYELQEPSSASFTPQNKPPLISRLDKLESDVRAELRRQGFEGERVHVERMLNMRFEGTDTALMVLPTEADGDGNEDFEAAFKRAYMSEFGFLLETKSVTVDDLKVGHMFRSRHLEV